jgi:uncharacterized membrane protein
MTTTSPALLAPPKHRGLRRWLAMGVIGSGLVVVATLAVLNGAHPHLPDLSLLNGQPPAILTHLAGALLALGLGVVQLVGPKGTTAHRLLGWSWCLLMLAVAGSSLFIHVLNRGGFSLIHILSAWVLIATPLAILAARRQDRRPRELHAGPVLFRPDHRRDLHLLPRPAHVAALPRVIGEGAC